MDLLFTTPQTRATVKGGGTISGLRVKSIGLDPDTLVYTIVLVVIEEDSNIAAERIVVKVPATGSSTLAQLKTDTEAALTTKFPGVTFQ